MIRQFLHFILVMIASLIWLVIYWLFVICFLIIILADKIYPNINKGNCWTYAPLKWLNHGGYLAIRNLSDNKFLNKFPVVHVLWIKEFSKENKIEQAIPVNRQKKKWLPLQVFYFPYKISEIEKPHNAKIQ